MPTGKNEVPEKLIEQNVEGVGEYWTTVLYAGNGINFFVPRSANGRSFGWGCSDTRVRMCLQTVQVNNTSHIPI